MKTKSLLLLMVIALAGCGHPAANNPPASTNAPAEQPMTNGDSGTMSAPMTTNSPSTNASTATGQ